MASEQNDVVVKLLNFCLSPVGCRVVWGLKLKGVEYEYIEEDIFNKSNLLLQMNPIHKKVPVLIHQNKPIAESLVILEYIDETWSQYYPLMPRNPRERALARFWAKFADEKVLHATFIAMCSNGDEKENGVKSIKEALEKIEEEIKGKKFFGGQKIGYLDLALGWMSYWLPIFEEVGCMNIMDPSKFSAINSWINNFLDHPLIKGTFPPRDKMIPYFQRRKNQFSSTSRGTFKV